MQRDVRSSVWLQRLVSSLTVVILVVVALGAPLIGTPSAYAAGRRGELGQSTAPDSASISSHPVYLPWVARQAPRSYSVFGVQMYGALASPGAKLDLAQTASVSWVRWPFSWESIEPSDTTPAHYNWASTDASFAAANTAGLNVIATMTTNPSWAASVPNGPFDRSGAGAFVEFMTAVVERYDGDGRNDAPGSPVVNYWEIYNEPDGSSLNRAISAGIGYWGPYPVAYAEMLCAIYPTVKAAAPNAQIVLGGMAYDRFTDEGGYFERKFLDNVLTAGGGRCLDAVAFHYYPPFEPVWAPYGPGLSGKANYLRNKLNSYGLTGVPLLVTETGHHSTNDPTWPSTPAIEAGYVIKLFTQAMASNIAAAIWFTWFDLPGYYIATGLLNVNGQPKLAYDALKAARTKLGNATFQRRLSNGETGSSDVEAYLFRGTYAPLYVVWANSSTHQVRLPGKTVRVSGLVGETLATVRDIDDGIADGLITVTARYDPIYVEAIE